MVAECMIIKVRLALDYTVIFCHSTCKSYSRFNQK